MGLFRKIEEMKPIAFPSGSSQVLGTSTIRTQFRLPRQSRRLSKYQIHLNVTIGASGLTTVPSANALEGILSTIQLQVSDSAGQNRSVIISNSATMIAANRRNYGEIDEYTAAAFGALTAATYDIFIDCWLENPEWSSIIGPRTALPLYAPALADDPLLTFELNTLAGIGLGNASSVTVNYGELRFVYSEIPPEVAYIPTELNTTQIAWQGSGLITYDLPQNGLLLWYLHEELTSSTVRGFMQPDYGRWRLYYGRTALREYSSKCRIAENALNMRRYRAGSTLAVTNDVGITLLDLFHDSPLGDAISGASVLDLYSLNKGDRAQLQGTNIPANAISLLTTYKALITDPSLLNGA